MLSEPKRGKVRGLPRALEVLVAAIGLILLSPLIVTLSLVVFLSSKGGVLYRQERVGHGGRSFTLVKFRSMTTTTTGTAVTAAGDCRITSIGRFLRRSKLDELPELWNVLRGEMALVGPRPEVPAFVELGDPRWSQVLTERPGLTHPVTLRLRHEERLLAAAPGDVESFYRQQLLPYKLRGYLAYQKERTWKSDLKTLGRTVVELLPGREAPPPSFEDLSPKDVSPKDVSPKDVSPKDVLARHEDE